MLFSLYKFVVLVLHFQHYLVFLQTNKVLGMGDEGEEEK